MSKGIYGSPRLRGNSEVITSASYSDDNKPEVGKACSPVSNDNGELVVGAFDGATFAGFVSAGDVNTKQKTLSLTQAGLDVPVKLAEGKLIGATGGQVGLTADGAVVDAADADAVVLLNGVCREVGVEAHGGQVMASQYDSTGDTEQVSIDFTFGISLPAAAAAGDAGVVGEAQVALQELQSATTAARKATTEATKATTEATKATTEATKATTEATKATTEATKAVSAKS